MEQKRNPFIENFCRVLVYRKEVGADDEAKERIVESLYDFLENRLGRNLVELLPEGKKAEFIALYERGARDLDEGVIKEFFEGHEIDFAAVLKKTMQEVAELYFRNRPGQLPPPWVKG